ncbi:uncharacterized protein LOC121429291 [Lytechinus variegatus]|uniref:uncharacterized protein LOC121429291 n=1 Tax=Lytechinus variegatus TaxID=7654 RepID=UPI001BB2BF4B|nr:uncharacterized protein LOC121429291 [Lytechinus variegatus]XP_041482225.1 uncharacterized protein LOC121429291 [Lytechinus variegatus]
MATTEVNINEIKLPVIGNGYPVDSGNPPQKNYVTTGVPPPYQSVADNTAQPVDHTVPHNQGMVRQAPSQQPIPDYTAFAVMVTILFCVPLGMMGIVKATEARNKRNQGDDEGAREAAQNAFRWSLSGLIVGSIVLVIVIIFYVVLQSRY